MRQAALSACETLRSTGALRAFHGFGLEIEYMIVAESSFDVSPIADTALLAIDGKHAAPVNDVARGEAGWSNELVAHLLELKNVRPTPSLEQLPARFQEEITAMTGELRRFGAKLLPGGMHPWMDPARETRLWPHGGAAIYQAYDRIFDCRRHGWANVQSVHVNLPFGDAAEFALLHEAIRLALPILPAIAAGSPFAQAQFTGFMDYRMELYRDASAAIPSITGRVVPEPVASPAEYVSGILAPMYGAIAPRDPEGVLQHEWLNARGAIARFDRNAIEIRVLDAQECPRADVAMAALTIDLVRMLYGAMREGGLPERPIPGEALAKILEACTREGERAWIDHSSYLAALGVPRPECSAGGLWSELAERLDASTAPYRALWRPWLMMIERRGPLARRMLHVCGETPSTGALIDLCADLSRSLEQGLFYDP